MRLHSAFSVLGFTLLLVSGCGGGGGGGAPAITYSGVTSEATVDETSARELSDTALTGTSGDALIFRSEAGNDGDPLPSLNLAGLAQTLAQAATSVDPTASGSKLAAGATQTESATEYGSCGGSLSYTITADDVTGAFSGTFTFNNLDNCTGEVLNGSANISGTLNLSTLLFEDFTFTFTSLSVTSGGGTETISGSIAFTETSSFSWETTYNIVFQDAVGDTYQLVNYVVTFDESSSPIVVTFSGRVYHPDYGYVTVSTTTPVQIYWYNDYPHAGVIVLTGAPGSGGGPTTATVTFTGTNSYTIDVDSDGDGAVDTNHICTWSPDVCS